MSHLALNQFSVTMFTKSVHGMNNADSMFLHFSVSHRENKDFCRFQNLALRVMKSLRLHQKQCNILHERCIQLLLPFYNFFHRIFGNSNSQPPPKGKKKQKKEVLVNLKRFSNAGQGPQIFAEMDQS